jgi:hypothetical protein
MMIARATVEIDLLLDFKTPTSQLAAFFKASR